VRIDATDLHQLLFNLILNARDAIDGHGEIGITLLAPRGVAGNCAACHRELDGEYVELAVSDSGCGINDESLSRIFEPFYSTKDVGKGTGMGLSVLHGIVHRVGGHVLVNSMPGVGTVMRVLLRAGEAPPRTFPQAPAPAPAQAAPRCGDAPLRVLVVDDEPSIVRFLCEWLEVEGFVSEAFTDPLAARNWAARDDAAFDVLITDQTMPGMTGLELAAVLRERRPRLPVIVCTGLADRVSASQAAELGMVQMFLKPVPMPELLKSLHQVTTACDVSNP
jgi:CheY-like chemotaxis protein